METPPTTCARPNSSYAARLNKSLRCDWKAPQFGTNPHLEGKSGRCFWWVSPLPLKRDPWIVWAEKQGVFWCRYTYRYVYIYMYIVETPQNSQESPVNAVPKTDSALKSFSQRSHKRKIRHWRMSALQTERWKPLATNQRSLAQDSPHLKPSTGPPEPRSCYTHMSSFNSFWKCWWMLYPWMQIHTPRKL